MEHAGRGPERHTGESADQPSEKPPGEHAGVDPGAKRAAEPREGEGKTPDKPVEEKGRLTRARGIVEWAKTILTALLLVVVLRAFVVEAYVVKGASMEPTFYDAERLLINKLAPRFQDLQQGDVIVFQHPDQPGRRLIKRIIGLPGDYVEIRRGRVAVNGKELEEVYLAEENIDPGDNMYGYPVPPGEIFVLGDHRIRSNDSRRFGSIPEALVVGRTFLRIYPFRRARFF
jgi:signal peptidase I